MAVALTGARVVPVSPARLVVSDPETADLAEIVGRSPVIGQVARSLRISDGPDEVHRQVVGRYELARRK